MVTIQGVSGVGGPKALVPAANREQPAPDSSQTQPKDSVSISSQSSTAALAQQVVQSSVGSEIRQAQVDAAKAKLAEGTYKLQSVVLQVASRISNFVE